MSIRAVSNHVTVLQLVALLFVLVLPAGALAADPPEPCVAPPATTTLSPKPGTDNDPFPDFSWEVVPQANWYQIWINKDGATFKTMWLFGQTTWTPGTPLADGAYEWWVQTWSPCGAGPWADGGTYVVDCSSPSAPSLDSPSDGSFMSYDHNFNFSWHGSDDASWAQLWIRRNGQDFFNQWVQYPFGYGSKDYYFGYGVLSNGAYEWQVREWSPCGGTGDWSTSRTFTNDVPACTEAPGLISSINVNLYFWPLGSDPTNSASAVRPSVNWSGTGAPWYRLDVYRNGSLYLTDWVDHSNNWDADEDLPAGDYDFYVRGWNACGLSAWPTAASTSLVCRATNEIANLTALPCGFGYGYGSGDGIAFSWDALPGVSWYQVYVSKDGATVYNEWQDLHNEGGPLGVMSSTGTIVGSPPMPCAAGDYEVWIRGWSRPCGYTIWAGTDTLIECSLDAPVLVGPSGDLSNPRPALEWEAVTGAEQYTVQLTRDGSPYHTETVSGSSCGTETIEPNSFAMVGNAKGWNQDDGWWTLPLPFSFPFCGQNYTECYVGSNGTITFDYGDSQCCGGDEQELSERTMIAVMWDDLHTDLDAGDDIYVTTNATEVTIRWQGGYCCSVANGDMNISCTLYADGTIRMRYGPGNPASDNLIGISAGNQQDYLVSSRSGTSHNNDSDIVVRPGNPTWRPFWSMPLGDYQWWVQPASECAGQGPLSPSGSFNLVPFL